MGLWRHTLAPQATQGLYVDVYVRESQYLKGWESGFFFFTPIIGAPWLTDQNEGTEACLQAQEMACGTTG